MNARLATLKRIETLYGMVEEMHSVALRQTMALVHEVEAAIFEQQDQMREVANGAHQALLEGDRQEWVLAGAQRELGRIKSQRLEAVRLQRNIATEQARAEYSASRINSEQMKSVVKRCQTKDYLIAERKSQAATDDRFLSRMRWNELRLEGIMKHF